MRVLIYSLLILTTAITLIFALGFNKTVAAMQLCLDAATITSQNDLAWLTTSQPSTADLCGRASTQYQTLETCYRQITQKYFIPTSLVETIMVRSIPNYPRLARNQEFLKRACPATHL